MKNHLNRFVSHPLAINSFRHWRRLTREFGRAEPGHRVQAAKIMLLSPLTSPLRAMERRRYERYLNGAPVEAPVFVIGHWRTGTTHLHNLLSQDPQFGWVSTYQAIAPGSFLVGEGVFKRLVALIMPKKRHTDNMVLTADSPQEEEFAMCTLCPYSFYVGWYFPKAMRDLFRKYVLFDGVSRDVIDEWKRIYLGVLKKASHHFRGKRLVLKNPVNTGRIRVLLELFPDARFVHIYRDPYVVFKSTQLLHRATIDMIGLQNVTDAEIEENVLRFFEQMMRRFFEERSLIPPENVVDVRYEDLERRPVDELRRVYDTLCLPGWAAACPRMEQYLAAAQGYEKNRFVMSLRDMEKVEAHWRFALDAWGYTRPAGEADT